MIKTRFGLNPAIGSGVMTRALSPIVGPQPRTLCFASSDDEFIGGGGTPNNVVDLFTQKPVQATSTSITAHADTPVQESTITSLIDAMISGDEAAKQKLVDIGEHAVEPLCSLVGDGDLKICLPAIETLGKLGDARAIDPLFEVLDANGNLEVRPYVEEALLGIGGMKIVGLLVERLSDDDLDWNPADLLVRTGDERAIASLANLILSEPTKLPQNKPGALHAARSAAARALGKTHHPNAVPPLIKALGPKYEDICWSVIDALGELRDGRAFKPVLRFFDHERLEIGLAVIGALEAIDPARLVDESFARLGHEKEVVRNRAIRALTKIGGKRGTGRSIGALSSENIDVRRCAAYVLGNISAEQAKPSLIDLLQDDDEGVRDAATYALYEIGYKVHRIRWRPISSQS